MATIDNLTLEITANTNKAVADLQKLASALSALKGASKGISASNLNKVANAFSNIKYSITGISLASIRRVERLADALERVASVDAKNLSSVSKAISKMGVLGSVATPKKKTGTVNSLQLPTVIENNKPEVSKQLPAVISTMPSVIRDEDTEKAKEYYGTWREIGSSALYASLRLNRIRATMASLKAFVGDKALEYFKDNLKSIGDTAKKILAPLSKLARALGRIMLYRAIRGLLKSITQGVKEGIENLAIYSKAINELDSAKANYTMSQLATAFLYLKNSVASAVMPIIQQFTPAILKMVNACVNALNIINQLVSAMQGKTTFTKAKTVWVDYAGSLDKATQSAKKLHHQLAGFDELNNLTAPSVTGKDSLDPTLMFEEAPISNKWLMEAEKLKKVFEEIKSLIPVIGAGILAWTIGSKLADFLTTIGLLGKNGGIQLAIGLTLTAVGFALEGTSIIDIIKNGLNLENFGKSVGGAILASIGSWITANLAGDLLAPMVSALTGLGVTASGLLVSGIIGGLGTALAGIGLTVAGIWDSVVNGIDWLSAILTSIGGTLTGAGIGAIVGAIVGALGGPIGAGVGALIGTAIGAGISIIVNGIILIVQNFDKIKSAFAKVGEFIKQNWQDAMEYTKKLVTDLVVLTTFSFKLIEKASKDGFNKVKNNIVTNINTAKMQVETVATTIQNRVKGITDTISAEAMKITLKIATTVNNMETLLKQKTTAIKETISRTVSDFATNISKKAKEIHSTITTFIQNTSSWVSTNIPKIATTIWSNIKNIPYDFLTIANQATVNFNTLPAKIGEQLNLAFTKFSSFKESITNWAKEQLPKAINSIIDWFAKLPEALYNVGVNMVKGLWNGVISVGNWLYDKVKSFFGSLWSIVGSYFGGIGRGYSTSYNSIPHYASGGYVSGDLFVANERGAEMVGSVNGRTAVANNDQIAEAIAQATYSAMTRALSENDGTVRIVVEGDGDKMFKVFQKKQREYGRSTGFAY